MAFCLHCLKFTKTDVGPFGKVLAPHNGRDGLPCGASGVTVARAGKEFPPPPRRGGFLKPSKPKMPKKEKK